MVPSQGMSGPAGNLAEETGLIATFSVILCTSRRYGLWLDLSGRVCGGRESHVLGSGFLCRPKISPRGIDTLALNRANWDFLSIGIGGTPFYANGVHLLTRRINPPSWKKEWIAQTRTVQPPEVLLPDFTRWDECSGVV